MARFEKVTVTGGSGRLGRYVVEELEGRCRLTTLDVAPAATPHAHVEVDVLDLGALHRAFGGQDAVVHIGAIDAHVDATAETFFRTNALGTWNVLHAAEQAGVQKVLVCSSNAVTGHNLYNRHMPPLYLPYDEDHPLRPTHVYGLSKQMGELIGESFARRGTMEVAVLRPTYVAFPEMVRLMAARVREPERTDFPWLPSGTYLEPLQLLRSYVEPSDAARCFRLALETASGPFATFFTAAADTFEPEPTLPYLERAYGTLPEVRKPWVYERNPNAGVVDCTRAREVLGWEPTSRWPDMVARFGEGAGSPPSSRAPG